MLLRKHSARFMPGTNVNWRLDGCDRHRVGWAQMYYKNKNTLQL